MIVLLFVALRDTFQNSDQSNNKFVYRFPNTQTFEVGSSIGLSSISIYNSTFNIEKNRGNNVIQIIWLGTTYTIIIDDGYYNVSDLNFKIQQFCILNNLYLLSNSGSNIIYFVELVMNSVRYSVQLNLYAIPTEAQSLVLGYSKVGSTWNFPLVATTPQLNILSQTFGTDPLHDVYFTFKMFFFNFSRSTVNLLIKTFFGSVIPFPTIFLILLPLFFTFSKSSFSTLSDQYFQCKNPTSTAIFFNFSFVYFEDITRSIRRSTKEI